MPVLSAGSSTMSGIVGIWNRAGRPVEERLLTQISAPLAHRGPDGESRWVRGPVGLACHLLRATPESLHEVQPLVHPSGAVVVFDGRLDNRADLIALLGADADLAPSAPDPELVLAAYTRFGLGFLERLNGDFALALFDPRQPRLLLARDAIGVRPLYYHRVGNAILFASEIKAILAHPEAHTRPNDDLLADFLVGSRCQGNLSETFFEGIYRVPPAHVVAVSPEALAVRRYWDFDPSHRISLRSFENYADAFRNHFETAVGRRLRSTHPVAVSVSGGLDSSAILCVAESLRRRAPGRYAAVRGVSYVFRDGSPCDEEAFLAEIEQRHGISIERVLKGPPGFTQGSREEVWHVEAPFLDAQWNGTEAFFARVSAPGTRVLLTGHWGDQMLVDQAYLLDLAGRLAWGRIWSDLREFRRWCPDGDPGHFRRRFLRDLARWVVPEPVLPLLRRLRHLLTREAGRPGPYTAAFRARATRAVRPRSPFANGRAHFRSLYREARSGYTSLCLEWNSQVSAMHGTEAAFPFLDRDLIAFLMAIPGEIQTWQGVPKGLLRESLRPFLPEAIVNRKGKADFTHRVNAGVQRDRPDLIKVLEADEVGSRLGYVERDAIKDLVARVPELAQENTCQAAQTVVELFGLVLWRNMFFDKGPAVQKRGATWDFSETGATGNSG
jgi:asparagine synthase (glutamine-hydrolysing)